MDLQTEVGLAIDFLFMAFAPTLWGLYVGRVLNGMTASSFSTAGAYVADVTAPERRAKTFGLIVLPTIFVLYTTHRYGWSPRVLGYAFFLTGVLG